MAGASGEALPQDPHPAGEHEARRELHDEQPRGIPEEREHDDHRDQRWARDERNREVVAVGSGGSDGAPLVPEAGTQVEQVAVARGVHVGRMLVREVTGRHERHGILGDPTVQSDRQHDPQCE